MAAGLSLLTPRFPSAERLLTVIHRRTSDASRLRALAIVAAIDIAVIVAGIGTAVLADAPLLPS
jgi:hypothetical protein